MTTQRRSDIVVTLPPVCDLDEAFMIVQAASETSPRPERLVIVAGTKLTNVPLARVVNGQWETVYSDVTTSPGDWFLGREFVTAENAAMRQAEWAQHQAFVDQMGLS